MFNKLRKENILWKRKLEESLDVLLDSGLLTKELVWNKEEGTWKYKYYNQNTITIMARKPYKLLKKLRRLPKHKFVLGFDSFAYEYEKYLRKLCLTPQEVKSLSLEEKLDLRSKLLALLCHEVNEVITGNTIHVFGIA